VAPRPGLPRAPLPGCPWLPAPGSPVSPRPRHPVSFCIPGSSVARPHRALSWPPSRAHLCPGGRKGRWWANGPVVVERAISPAICSSMGSYSRVRNARRSSMALKLRAGGCMACCKLCMDGKLPGSSPACGYHEAGVRAERLTTYCRSRAKRRCHSDWEISTVDFQNAGHPKRIHFFGLVHLRT